MQEKFMSGSLKKGYRGIRGFYFTVYADLYFGI